MLIVIYADCNVFKIVIVSVVVLNVVRQNVTGLNIVAPFLTTSQVQNIIFITIIKLLPTFICIYVVSSRSGANVIKLFTTVIYKLLNNWVSNVADMNKPSSILIY